MYDDLQPHPEGGAYAERYRSALQLNHPLHGAPRSALTLIHFQLLAGQASAWHQVLSDEIWLHLAGDGIEVFIWDGIDQVQRLPIGPAPGPHPSFALVPAGHWQAARPLGNEALVHCVVAPGFDFADFRLLRDDPALMAQLRGCDAEAAELG